MAGGSDTAITAWIIELWADKCNPYLDALSFVDGIGAILAPLMATPFLTGNPWNLVIPYMIGAAITLVISLVISLLVFSRRFTSREINQAFKASAQDLSNVSSTTEDFLPHELSGGEHNRTMSVVITGLGFLLMATYLAMEWTYLNFQSVFVQSYNMTEADASILASVTSAVFAINRGQWM